jgi:hypothetical protein
MNIHTSRVLYWSPRVLGLFYAGFITIFAADVFDERLGFWQTLVAILIHLIPTFLVLAAVAIGWLWDLAGAASFVALGLLYAANCWNHPAWILIIGGPTFVIGLLFFLNWLGMRRVSQ